MFYLRCVLFLCSLCWLLSIPQSDSKTTFECKPATHRTTTVRWHRDGLPNGPWHTVAVWYDGTALEVERTNTNFGVADESAGKWRWYRWFIRSRRSQCRIRNNRLLKSFGMRRLAPWDGIWESLGMVPMQLPVNFSKSPSFLLLSSCCFSSDMCKWHVHWVCGLTIHVLVIH